MATEIIRPNSNNNTLWATFDYTNIDDVVTQPSAGDGAICAANRDDDNETQIWGLSAPSTLVSITQAVVWVYQTMENSNSKTITVNLNIGGNWQTGQTFTSAIDQTLTWVSKTFTGTWTSADFASALVSLGIGTMGNADDFDVDVIYVELTGTAGDPGVSNNTCMTIPIAGVKPLAILDKLVTLNRT